MALYWKRGQYVNRAPKMRLLRFEPTQAELLSSPSKANFRNSNRSSYLTQSQYTLLFQSVTKAVFGLVNSHVRYHVKSSKVNSSTVKSSIVNSSTASYTFNSSTELPSTDKSSSNKLQHPLQQQKSSTKEFELEVVHTFDARWPKVNNDVEQTSEGGDNERMMRINPLLKAWNLLFGQMAILKWRSLLTNRSHLVNPEPSFGLQPSRGTNKKRLIRKSTQDFGKRCQCSTTSNLRRILEEGVGKPGIWPIGTSYLPASIQLHQASSIKISFGIEACSLENKLVQQVNRTSLIPRRKLSPSGLNKHPLRETLRAPIWAT